MRDNVDLHQESANQRAELDALRQDSADQKVKLRTQQQETDTLRDQVKVLQQRIAEVRYSFHLSFIILITFSSLKKKFSQSDVEHLLARYETALPNTLITATGEIIAMITVILMLTSRRTSHIRNNICQKQQLIYCPATAPSSLRAIEWLTKPVKMIYMNPSMRCPKMMWTPRSWMISSQCISKKQSKHTIFNKLLFIASCIYRSCTQINL